MTVRDRGIDERGNLDAIPRVSWRSTAGHMGPSIGVKLRESVIKLEHRELAISDIPHGRVRGISQCRLTNELVKRNSSVVNSVAAANSGLVVYPVCEAQPWSPGIMIGPLKGPLPAASRTLAR